QASVTVQLLAYSNSAFQNTSGYTSDVIFAASKNTSTTSNKVFAYRASDGALLWTFADATNGVGDITVMPYVDYARNRLYVASKAGTSGRSLWVLNTLTGAAVACTVCNLGDLDTTAPTVSYDGQTLYVASTTGNLYA